MAKIISRYLTGALVLKLHMLSSEGCRSNLTLTAYTVADYAVNETTRRSVRGETILIEVAAVG